MFAKLFFYTEICRNSTIRANQNKRKTLLSFIHNIGGFNKKNNRAFFAMLLRFSNLSTNRSTVR